MQYHIPLLPNPKDAVQYYILLLPDPKDTVQYYLLLLPDPKDAVQYYTLSLPDPKDAVQYYILLLLDPKTWRSSCETSSTAKGHIFCLFKLPCSHHLSYRHSNCEYMYIFLHGATGTEQ